MTTLEATLRARRDRGGKILVTYVTAGLPLAGGSSWIDVVAACLEAGADAVEIGLPFSDPVMDGPVIQTASQKALDAGTTPLGALAEVAASRDRLPGPLAAMTYYNLVHSAGPARFAAALSDAGIQGAILPDLPLDESRPWREAAAAHSIETIMLAAPTTPDARLAEVCAASSGFVYGVGLMGVTGLRDSLADSALAMSKRLTSVTDLPVLIGVGISDAHQARSVCEVADGVVVGSALIRLLLEGAGPLGAAALVSEIRQAIDPG